MVGGKLYLGKNENLISTRIISELEKSTNSLKPHLQSVVIVRRKESLPATS
jgi:hypothetical protein